MLIVVLGALLVVLAILAPLLVRPSALPLPEPESPTQHLEDRKAAIYENLRDLQSEYHMGKLSDDDYQETKLDLQKELAGVLAQIEAIESGNATTEASTEAAG